MSTPQTTNQLIEKLAKEIGRLQKLCKDNGIDYLPPNKNPGGSISCTPKIEVFGTKKEAEEAMKKIEKTYFS